jgi:hypothetical protein
MIWLIFYIPSIRRNNSQTNLYLVPTLLRGNAAASARAYHAERGSQLQIDAVKIPKPATAGFVLFGHGIYYDLKPSSSFLLIRPSLEPNAIIEATIA